MKHLIWVDFFQCTGCRAGSQFPSANAHAVMAALTFDRAMKTRCFLRVKTGILELSVPTDHRRGLDRGGSVHNPESMPTYRSAIETRATASSRDSCSVNEYAPGSGSVPPSGQGVASHPRPKLDDFLVAVPV